MISSDLLFQVDPLYIIHSIGSGDIILIGCASIFIALIFTFFYRQKSGEKGGIEERKVEKTFKLPRVDDRDFETRVAQIIRNIIGYPSHLPDAHTAREIEQYKENHPLFSVLADLEKREYQGKILTQDERGDILRVLLEQKNISS